jgi:hypothetical protein
MKNGLPGKATRSKQSLVVINWKPESLLLRWCFLH